MLNSPLVFEALPMERVWGGRRLESVLGRSLPNGTLVGESWEVVDRPDAQSVVHGGSLRGMTLHDLWSSRREEIFGKKHKTNTAPRFPILVKILDARERLSVQVHPPADMAPSLHSEPKTEVWFFLDSLPGAKVYAGMKCGVTRDSFQSAINNGRVEQELHEVPALTGGSIFIPSGRLHAIGEGNLIIEVQQNSDTTYRVFDWNRLGLDGQPRALHIEESLASINFNDSEPAANIPGDPVIADCPFFRVEERPLPTPTDVRPADSFAILAVIHGRVPCGEGSFSRGSFFLVPAGDEPFLITPLEEKTSVLVATLPA